MNHKNRHQGPYKVQQKESLRSYFIQNGEKKTVWKGKNGHHGPHKQLKVEDLV